MGTKFNYAGITYDDIVEDNDGHIWSQICPDCLEKYGDIILQSWLDDNGSGICGVQGCRNEAEYYIDFPKKM